MANFVPVEIREKVVGAYENGEGTLEEVAARFSVGEASVLRWLALKRETGAVVPKAPRKTGRPRELDQEDCDALKQLVKQHPAMGLRGLQKKLEAERGKSVSYHTVRNYLKRMGLVHKRNEGRKAMTASPVPEPREPLPRGAKKPTSPDPAEDARSLGSPVLPDPVAYRYREKDRLDPKPRFYDRQHYPSDLTDEEWKILEPLLAPPPERGGKPRTTPLREIVDAVRYIARTGCQWRYLPHDFPDWQLVAKTYYRWVKSGKWKAVNDALRERVRVAEGREPQPTAAIIDSQSVKTTEKGGRKGSTGARRSTGGSATSS